MRSFPARSVSVFHPGKILSHFSVSRHKLDVEIVDALIALNSTGMVGSVLLGRLVERGWLERLDRLARKDLLSVEGVGEKTAEAIRTAISEGAAERERRIAEKLGIRILTLLDPEYPELLRAGRDPPLVLYLKGTLTAEDRRAIAIVGCRFPSLYGREQAERLAGQLAALGISVTSGLARGIDTAAHEGAWSAGGRSIAVLGSGLARIYPRENQDLAERIAARGAVMSEFPIESEARPSNFPRRNRIIAGLSLGTICVEASLTSGALSTVDWALEMGREVFAVPGRADNPLAAGPALLIQQGAKLVIDAADVLEEIPGLRSLMDPGGMEADPVRKALLAQLARGAAGLKELCRATRMREDVVSRGLSELILMRRVVREPANRFRRVTDS